MGDVATLVEFHGRIPVLSSCSNKDQFKRAVGRPFVNAPSYLTCAQICLDCCVLCPFLTLDILRAAWLLILKYLVELLLCRELICRLSNPLCLS